MATRSYVEPDVTKDWHKLDVKHVSGLLVFERGWCLVVCVMQQQQKDSLSKPAKPVADAILREGERVGTCRQMSI